MSWFKKAIGGIGGVTRGAMEQAGAQAAAAEEDARQRKIKEWNAKLDPLRKDIDNMQGPQAVALESADSGYKAKTFNGPLPEFEATRQKVLGQVSSAKSQNIAAIQRKAAALGATGGGAFMKQTQLASEAGDQQALDATTQIGAQESAAKRELNAAEENKVFQSQEAIKGRNLSREAMNADQQFKFGLAKIDARSKLAGLELAFDDAERSRANEKYNMELAEYQKKHSGGLLGAGGFLGTGIGA